MEAALDLVLLDVENPRSLLYQIEQLKSHISALPTVPDVRHELREEARSILEVETLVKLSRLHELGKVNKGERETLKHMLEKIQALLGATSNSVSEKYFEHRETSRQLVNNFWESNS